MLDKSLAWLAPSVVKSSRRYVARFDALTSAKSVRILLSAGNLVIVQPTQERFILKDVPESHTPEMPLRMLSL